MTTHSQRYNRFIRNVRNAIPKHAGPEAKGSNPTVGLTLLWACNPFRGNFNHWQISRKEAGQIFFFYSDQMKSNYISMTCTIKLKLTIAFQNAVK